MSSAALRRQAAVSRRLRSEEHTSELQSRSDLVCRLLLEKKKKGLAPTLYSAPITGPKLGGTLVRAQRPQQQHHELVEDRVYHPLVMGSLVCDPVSCDMHA